ncbi:MAG: Gfo/Idh/MocA family oxidoreductase [Candidatus Omnitrophota bacterium]
MARIGIIGCGGMGNMHTQACLVSGAAEIAAVADERVESAEKLAKQANCEFMSSPEDLIRRDDVDAVMICTPTPSHYPLAMLALAQGKHLFVEKPLCRALAQAKELAAEAKKNNVVNQVGHVLRFWPEYVRLKEACADGRWGKLTSMKFVRTSAQPGWSAGNWLLNPELSGGAALDLHLHDTDMVLYLAGKPKAVVASGVKDYAGWRQIHTQYFYDGGPAVYAEGAWYEGEKYPFRMGFVALFEKGVLDYDCTRPEPFLFYPKEGEPETPVLPDMPKTKPVEGINVTNLGGYLLQDAYFFKRLAGGEASPAAADFEAGCAALQVVEAEIQSLEQREIVQV